MSPDLDRTVATALAKWRESLLDLGRANRLLNYRPSRTASLQVVAPRDLFRVLDDLDADGRGWTVFEPPDVDEAAPSAGPPDAPSAPADGDVIEGEWAPIASSSTTPSAAPADRLALPAPSDVALARDAPPRHGQAAADAPPDPPPSGAAPPPPRPAPRLAWLATAPDDDAEWIERDLLLLATRDGRPPASNLKGLARRAATELAERGVHTLFVAAGILSWRDGPELAHSPLLLFPVQLRRASLVSPWELHPVEEEIVVNPALVLKLERDLKFHLPPLPSPEDADRREGGALCRAYFAAVRAALPPGGAMDLHEQAWLDVFSFMKHVIYVDLGENAARALAHPIVRALAGDHGAVASLPHTFSPAEDLDRLLPPADCFHVVDADSSQLVVLEAARRGVSLVLQGPPGTGKSQTITNLIGQALADGKTVLFVSEKMAALEVVKSRLAQQHLGPLCLELHSHKTSRRDVVERLRRALERHARVAPDALPSPAELERLAVRRDALNGYVRAIHARRHALGRSVFSVLAELAALHDAPLRALSPAAPPVARLDAATWQRLGDELRILRDAYDVVREGDAFPWRDAKPLLFSGQTRATLEAELDAVRDALDAVAAAAADGAASVDLPSPGSLDDSARLLRLLDRIAAAPRLPHRFFDRDRPLRPIIEAGRRLASAHDSAARDLEAILGARPEGTAVPAATMAAERDRLDAAARAIGWSAAPPPAAMGEAAAAAAAWAGDVARVEREATAFAAALGLAAAPVTTARAEMLDTIAARLVDGATMEAIFLDPASLQRARTLLAARRDTWTAHREALAACDAVFDRAVLDLDLDGLVARWRTDHRGFLRILSSRYRADRRTVRALLRRDAREDEFVALLEVARAARAARDDDATHAPAEREALGRHAAGRETDVAAVERDLDVAARCLQTFADRPLPAGLRDAMTAGDLAHPDLRAAAARLRDATTALRAHETAASSSSSSGVEPPPPPAPPAGLLAGRAAAAEAFVAAVHAATSALHPLLAPPWNRVDWDAMQRAAATWESLAAADRDLAAFAARDAPRLEDDWDGLATNWERLAQLAAEADALADEAGGAPPGRLLALLDAAPRPTLDAAPLLRDTLARADAALATLGARFASGTLRCGTAPAATCSFDAARAHLALLRSRLGDLELLMAFGAARDRLAALGWWGAVEPFLDPALDGPAFERAVRRNVLQAWADATIAADPALAGFRGQDHERLIAEFRALDLRLLAAAPHRVLERVGDRSVAGEYGEAGIIRREAAKKSRYLPIRRLMRDCPTIIPRLMPCFMMSPLSVSQFLKDSPIAFDLVVFDEASQIFVEDAVASIFRAGQAIICGDEKQLPPTNFFRAGAFADADDDADDDDAEGGAPASDAADFESVLKLAAASLPGGREGEAMLRWHYRSRHESLIAFSNHRCYASGLVTFPSSHERSPHLGVHFLHVRDGVYDRGRSRTNRDEATAILDLALRHWHERPTESLGIVTLSQAQQDHVLDVLERHVRRHRELEPFLADVGPEPFFVKNLENVQGDERDHIVLGLGYGPDKAGRLTQNFGPLNKAGGERRLNVAITRAKRRLTLVASFTHDKLRITEATPAGVVHLHKFLEYAERGEAALDVAHVAGGEAESGLERDIAAAIGQLGFEVTHQVGCSGFRIDLGVRHPARPGLFVLGVECDGATYHSSATARDRDRLRQSVLERLGWRIHRVWGPDWTNHREREIARLDAAIREAVARAEEEPPPPPPPPPPPSPPSPPDATHDGTDAREAMGSGERAGRSPTASPTAAPSPPARDWVEPFRAAELDVPPQLRAMHPADAPREALAILLALVGVQEQGASVERAMRTVAAAFGFKSLGPKIRRALEEAFAGGLPPSVQVEDGFIYPRPYAARVRLLPGGGDAGDDASPAATSPRSLDDVPPREMARAFAGLLAENGRMAREELVRATVELYGGRRLTAPIRALVEARLDADLDARRLATDADGRVHLP